MRSHPPTILPHELFSVTTHDRLRYARAAMALRAHMNHAVIAPAPMVHAGIEDLLNYTLPPQLIAQAPEAARGRTRLLITRGDALQDGRFADLLQLLSSEDVLVINTSRVMKARLFGRRETSGKVELLLERLLPDGTALAQIRSSHALPQGSVIFLQGKARVHVIAREPNGFYRLHTDAAHDWPTLLQRQGVLPLPPYIRRTAGRRDARRYQTLYGEEMGSVAAPTAGLHFTAHLLKALVRRGVIIAPLCLHVGAGTFQPVRDLAQHQMHRELFTLPKETVDKIIAAQARGNKVVAVGTTSVRALESAALQTAGTTSLAPSSGETELFIRPGFRFRVVNAMVTNFHQPHTSLLLLVAALGGVRQVQHAYAHAIEAGYRFLSYGDAMYIERNDE